MLNFDNADNSSLFVNGKDIYKFKINNNNNHLMVKNSCEWINLVWFSDEVFRLWKNGFEVKTNFDLLLKNYCINFTRYQLINVVGNC